MRSLVSTKVFLISWKPFRKWIMIKTSSLVSQDKLFKEILIKMLLEIILVETSVFTKKYHQTTEMKWEIHKIFNLLNLEPKVTFWVSKNQKVIRSLSWRKVKQNLPLIKLHGNIWKNWTQEKMKRLKENKT